MGLGLGGYPSQVEKGSKTQKMENQDKTERLVELGEIGSVFINISKFEK
jgi:hypothetical protein